MVPQFHTLENIMPKLSGFSRTLPFIALCLFLAQGLAAVAQSPYHILDRWKLGGDGGWDYMLVDSAAHRLYITHGNRVEAVDTTTGKPAGAITGLHGFSHGIALDTDGKTGYISDGGGNAVVVFDRSNFSTLATIAVGTNPDAILFDPSTNTVWTFNGRSHDISVVDAAARKVVATIPVPGKPEFAATDGKGNIYDNIEDKNEIIRLDAGARKITAEWPLAGCESPSGLAFDTASSHLFAVCDAKVMAIVNATSGKEAGKAAICDGPDAAGWDPNHKLAFASCGDGNLAVVKASGSKFETVEMLPTERGARTMAYDPATDRIYTVTAEFGPRPAPTADNPHPRPAIVPNSFTVIVMGR